RRQAFQRNAGAVARRGLELQRMHFAVRERQKLVGEAEFIEHLEGRRMNSVAAEVAEKVVVFFEDDDGDARAGEKQTEDGAGGSAAGDGARGRCWRSHIGSMPAPTLCSL